MTPMHIYIPTYRRVNDQRTIKMMPRRWLERTTLVCDKKDAKHGLREIAEEYGCSILVVPIEIETIAQKRAWLLRTTEHRRILMMDDDLRFCQRKFRGPIDDWDYSQINATKKEVRRGLDRVNKKLRSFAHVGIGPKQGNQTKANWYRFFAPNTRMIYALGYNVAIVRRTCKLGRIEHREDMDYNLQLLRAGYENRVLVDLCVDQVYNKKGGASEQRTMEASNADAEKLAKLHKGFVRVVEKDYKVVINRKEVVCYWKKAFEASQH